MKKKQTPTVEIRYLTISDPVYDTSGARYRVSLAMTMSRTQWEKLFSRKYEPQGRLLVYRKPKQSSKKFHINTAVKKAIIFTAVFVASSLAMGNMLHSFKGEEQLVAAMYAKQQAIQAKTTVPVVEEKPPVVAIREQVQQLHNQIDIIEEVHEENSVSEAETPIYRPLIEMTSSAPEGFIFCEGIPLSLELQKYTYGACIKNGLEYELVLALMWRESRFQTNAIGYNTNGTQDSGIMQINDVNRGWLKKQYGIANLLDPIQNIDAGTLILGEFVRKYGVHDSLMAYQYGEYGMQKKFEQGVFTNGQIAMLLERRELYRAMVQDCKN